MARLVVFLQNAHSTMWTEDWDRPAWMRALRRCHTGRRLNRLLGPDWDDVHVDNTTTKVGDSPSSKLEPDRDHINRVLLAQSPQAVVLCGRVAEEAVLPLWDGRALVMPHPAFKALTNALMDRAAELLRTLDFRRVAVRQGRGCFTEEQLPELPPGRPMPAALYVADENEKGKR